MFSYRLKDCSGDKQINVKTSLMIPQAYVSLQNRKSRVKIVGSEVHTVVSKKMAVFWVVEPYSLVEVYQRFRGPCCQVTHCRDDGGSKYLWNVGKLLPDHTALQPRRQSFWVKISVVFFNKKSSYLTRNQIHIYVSRIWGFHGGEYEDCCLLGCSTV
jgi:hypothetical protein